MAQVSVQEDGGGDYTSVNAALGSSETDILIEGEWDNPETNHLTVSLDSSTIQTSGSAKHPGYNVSSTPTHYRLEPIGSGHSLTISGNTCTIDGPVIKRTASPNTSDEGIRLSIGDNDTVTIKNCIIWSPDKTTEQTDGIYHANSDDITITIQQCVFYGWERGGIHAQCYTISADITQTYNINSCTVYENGATTVAYSHGGIILDQRKAEHVHNMNIFNTISMDNTNNADDADYNEHNYTASKSAAGTTNWNIDYAIDSDGSIANLDGSAVGSLGSHNATDDNNV
jgi:hypothetical protein